MSAPAWWFWALLALVLVGLYLSQTAGRLDRLHIRVDNARAALDLQLLRRSAAAMDLATSGALDPASSLVLAEAATRARTVEEPERAEAEGILTVALNAALPDAMSVQEVSATPGGADLVDELAAVTRRVELAQAFVDEAVRGAASVRAARVVRMFRLAGRAPWPTAMSFDAQQPDGFATP